MHAMGGVAAPSGLLELTALHAIDGGVFAFSTCSASAPQLDGAAVVTTSAAGEYRRHVASDAVVASTAVSPTHPVPVPASAPSSITILSSAAGAGDAPHAVAPPQPPTLEAVTPSVRGHVSPPVVYAAPDLSPSAMTPVAAVVRAADAPAAGAGGDDARAGAADAGDAVDAADWFEYVRLHPDVRLSTVMGMQKAVTLVPTVIDVTQGKCQMFHKEVEVGNEEYKLQLVDVHRGACLSCSCRCHVLCRVVLCHVVSCRVVVSRVVLSRVKRFAPCCGMPYRAVLQCNIAM
jgi:hypothetical protein